MSPFDWVMLTLGIGILAFVAPAAPDAYRAFWSGEHKWIREPMPRWWLWGEPLWHGYVRLFLISGPLMLIMVVGVLIGTFAKKGSPLMTIGYALADFLFFCIVVLLPALVLFARPKFLIPPPIRQQPGAIREWLDQRRRRREHKRKARSP